VKEPPPDDVRPVARGNYVDGYEGIMVRDWAKPGEKDLAKCGHRHRTTDEARKCILDDWNGHQ
jgi:hypothetical protein